MNKIREIKIYDHIDECTEYYNSISLWDFSKSNVDWNTRYEAIAKWATLSYGNFEFSGDTKRLVKSLWEKGHLSPFEIIRLPLKIGGNYMGYDISTSLRNHPELPTVKAFVYYRDEDALHEAIKWHRETICVFRMAIPVFVARQIMRHRFSYLELSRRWVNADKVPIKFHLVNSHGCVSENLFELSIYSYNILKFYGVSHELARSVLPLAHYTVVFVMLDYKNALNFFVDRFNKHTQRETRVVAKRMLELLKEHQPEFLGQYVLIDGKRTHILDLTSLNKSPIVVEYGSNTHQAIFDAKEGLFVGRTPKTYFKEWLHGTA